MDKINDYLEIVESIVASHNLDDKSPRSLYAPMTYTMALGGKRLRPLMLLLAYKAYQPNGRVEEVAPAMRAIELFHNFTLLHDDVMDDAPIRRGQPTVYKKWGSNTAILSGDGMLIEAYKHLAMVDPQKLPDALKLFNEMGSAVCEGQQYDMDFEHCPLSDVSLPNYVEMIRLKTSFLFCGAVDLGAYLANATDSERALLWKAIERMGLAFQIKDDYLDVYSQAGFGKTTGGDILEGKKTWLLLSAYAKDSTRLLAALAEKGEQLKIARVTQLYTQLGVDTIALEEVERLSQESIALLDQLALDKERLQPLRHLLLSLVKRET